MRHPRPTTPHDCVSLPRPRQILPPPTRGCSSPLPPCCCASRQGSEEFQLNRGLVAVIGCSALCLPLVVLSSLLPSPLPPALYYLLPAALPTHVPAALSLCLSALLLLSCTLLAVSQMYPDEEDTAAIPMDNPSCSCKPTRTRADVRLALRPAAHQRLHARRSGPEAARLQPERGVQVLSAAGRGWLRGRVARRGGRDG